jgi:hypothetical protein
MELNTPLSTHTGLTQVLGGLASRTGLQACGPVGLEEHLFKLYIRMELNTPFSMHVGLTQVLGVLA